MSYYETIVWGKTGLGSIISGGDGSLITTVFDADFAVIVAPSADYLVELSAGSGNYALTIPNYTPAAGDRVVISDGVVGPGHQLTFSPVGATGIPLNENVSIEFEDTRIG